MLPDFAGSLVLNVTRQVFSRCLPTYSSLSLRRFSGLSEGVATRPPAWCIKTEHQADWTRIPGTPTGTNIALGRRTHRQGVLELACSSVSSGDTTHMDEIHRLTRVTARGLHLSRQVFNTDTDRRPKGKGRLMRVGGLRRLASPTIEGVRRAPRCGSGVATIRGRRVTLPSFLA